MKQMSIRTPQTNSPYRVCTSTAFSLFAANLNFRFPKVVQQRRKGVVGNIKHLCSKFHKLASNKNFDNRLRFDKVTESLKVETFSETQRRNPRHN